MSVLCCVYGCDKEYNTDALGRMYLIPTELPEVTCDGANTVGARFDSILFVANYFPNTSSWGSPTPEDGVRAFFETASDGSIEYIQILGKHPIRPHEIDSRSMTFHMRYFHSFDSLHSVNLIYRRDGEHFDFQSINIPLINSNNLTFNPVDSTLCGTLPELKVPESNPRHFGDPAITDTIIMRDFRIDVPVHSGRY